MPATDIRADEATGAEGGAFFTRPYNAVTLAALNDMEESKALGIRGKDVETILAELRAD